MRARFQGLIVMGVAGLMLASSLAMARVPSVKFTSAGETYYWDAMYGVTGNIGLFRHTALGGDLDFLVTCTGTRSGGMQARLYEPQQQAIQLRLKAQDMVFRVNRQINDADQRPFVEGQGDLPDNFFAALAKSPQLTIIYGDKTRTIRGPGKVMAEDFRRYCDELRRRSLVDR